MIRYLLMLMLVIGVSLQAAEHLNWHTNYNEAVKASKESSKPLILFFTGSDWCGWCKKLDKEVFSTSEFINGAGDKYIFMEIDFPRNIKLPPPVVAQNEQLKNKYQIAGFPTLIILSPEEQEIGITGYKAGGPKNYIEHLKQIVDDYAKFKDKMVSLDNLSGKDLKRLYQKAKEFHLEKECQILVEKGVQSDAPLFFMGELYRVQACNGDLKDPQTVALKQKILQLDPDNKNLCHYQVAVVDFERLYEKMQNGTCTPEECVSPIVSYLDRFNDADHEWKLNMVISQVYLDKRRYSESLKYAEAAYLSAPETTKLDVAAAIQNIQTHLQSPQ